MTNDPKSNRTFPTSQLASSCLICILAVAATTPTAQADVEFSPDVTFTSSGVDVTDHDVAAAMAGSVTLATDLPTLPDAVEITSFLRDQGDIYFSVDTTASIEGVTVESRDIARWDGVTLTIEFDGSAVGVPSGVEIDALTVASPGGNLLISVDTSAVVGTLNVDDEDLFRVFPSPLMIFDGSNEGIDRALDLNGAAVTASGLGLFSFDGSGQVDGIDFDDEDVLSWNSTTGDFAMYFDGSAQGPEFRAVDITAVPEPSVSVLLPFGGLVVGGFRKRFERAKASRG